MFRQLSTVVLVLLMALGSLALAAAAEPKEAGGKTKSPPKELTVDLGKGIKLEMVLIPAGEFLMGSPDSDKDALTRREAAAPGSDHQAVLPGQVSGDAGAVGSRDGQQPEPASRVRRTRWSRSVGTIASSSSSKLNAKSARWGRQVPVAHAKPSGNMPAGRGARRGIASGTTSRSWANMRGMARTRAARRILLARRSRTPGGYTTCTGTHGRTNSPTPAITLVRYPM